MKRLIILGGGTGGIIAATGLRKKLSPSEWDILIIEQSQTHYYQSGFLYIPFGIYTTNDVIRDEKIFIPDGVRIIYQQFKSVNPEENIVMLENQEQVKYDILIVASGAKTNPELTPGMKDKLWYKNIFDFYTAEGARALSIFLKDWEGGRLVVNVADYPVKCPVASLEFAFLADAFFVKKGNRDKVNISYVTPLSGAFTRPVSSRLLGNILVSRRIDLVTDFYLSEVDNDRMLIKDFSGKEVPFDCLVTIPMHTGDPVFSGSVLGDEFGFIKTDRNSLQSKGFKNIFVIGDAGNFPTSKSGSSAHFQSGILIENVISFINNRALSASFDGHSNCFIETGFGKAILIDFNYDVEPLPGRYPFRFLGPFSLLKETRINHLGRLFFKWVYWKMLLKGRKLPLKREFSMKGKMSL
jgi:sulfide:quinone oxidoreductase